MARVKIITKRNKIEKVWVDVFIMDCENCSNGRNNFSRNYYEFNLNSKNFSMNILEISQKKRKKEKKNLFHVLHNLTSLLLSNENDEC